MEDCAVAHGNLSVVINTQPVIFSPAPFSNGQTVCAHRVSQIDLKQGAARPDRQAGACWPRWSRA